MRKFELLPPAAALARFNAALDEAWFGERLLGPERAPTAGARDRVLARDIAAPTDVPEFRRSTVDGYAVRSSDTPGMLRVVGDVHMGELSMLVLNPGEAARVNTGGNVPEGADAVVMIEHTQPSEQTTRVETQQRMTPGENVIQRGEDVRRGDPAIRAGSRIREAEIGGLLSFGLTTIDVIRRPVVAIIPSGDELVPPESDPQPGQIRQTNGAMLAAFVRRNGGIPIEFETIPDRLEAFDRAAERAMREADVVVFVAATSMGERDHVPDVVGRMGAPGIVTHGIAFRPGKPLLLAVCAGKPVFGLPGNPISALVTAELFLGPTLWRAQGALHPPQPRYIRATMASDMRSPRDLEHWFPVMLSGGADDQSPNAGPVSARPIVSKSNLIFSLVRAQGLVCAPLGVDRIAAGAPVDVRLLD